jgi:hypothetical protein
VFQDFLTSKLNTRVRFPSPAPNNFNNQHGFSDSILTTMLAAG